MISLLPHLHDDDVDHDDDDDHDDLLPHLHEDGPQTGLHQLGVVVAHVVLELGMTAVTACMTAW